MKIEHSTSLLMGLLLFGILTTPASAYLDPGTGTMLFQAVIAILMGLGVTIKIYWQKIKDIITREFH